MGDNFMEQRIHFNSPGSESGNFTKNLKLELRNNVERMRELKRHNSRQSLREDDSLMESHSTIKMSEKFAVNNFKETKKKRKKSPSPDYKAHPHGYQTRQNDEIQCKMDMINSLFDQLSCENSGLASANIAFITTSSYGDYSKNIKESSKNKTINQKITPKGQRPLEIQDLKESNRSKKNAKMLEPETKGVKNLNKKKKDALKSNDNEEYPEYYQLQANSYSNNIVLAETPQKKENIPNNTTKTQKSIINSTDRVENDSARGKKSKRSNRPEAVVEESSNTPPKQRQKPSVNPVTNQHPIIKPDSTRSKIGAGKNQGTPKNAVEEREEDEQQNQVGKILKNQNKPPLPQRSSNHKSQLKEEKQPDEEEDYDNNSKLRNSQSLRDQSQETQRDFLKQGSILISDRSPSKDHIRINKQQFKNSAHRLTKNYEKVLKNIDQNLKPFVQNLAQQSQRVFKTIEKIKKSPVSTNRSFNREGSIQIVGPTSSPARSISNNKKNVDIQMSPGSDNPDETSLREICENFMKSADSIKQFQSEINNLAKQITDAALIMQGTLQKLEHYRSIDSRGKASDQHDGDEDYPDDGYGSEDAAEGFGVDDEEQC